MLFPDQPYPSPRVSATKPPVESRCSKEKIGGKVIKEIFDEQNMTRRGGTVMLATGGSAKLPVSLCIKVNKVRFSHENLRRLQVVMGQSDRGIK